MPTGLYWLCLSTDFGINQYPACLHIATQVIPVYGQSPSPLPAFSHWQMFPPPKQLTTIHQLTAIGPATAEEDHDHWVQRVSEHLNHKGQAITAFDYERLVLEKFSHIGSASCFCHHRFDQDVDRPGAVLIIVMPKAETCTHAPCLETLVDSATLIEIRDYLLQTSQDDCCIEVRPPAYERLQVRARITLVPGSHHGPTLRQLEQAINTYLCPWLHESGNQGLGWQLELDKLAAFIGQHPAVISVAGLSVLKVSQRSATTYRLTDSACNGNTLVADRPWHLMIPMEHHHLDVAVSATENQPIPAGISDLVIGTHFIIGQAHPANTGGETHG